MYEPSTTSYKLDRRPVVGEHTLGDQDGRDGEDAHKGVNTGDDFGGSRFLHVVGLVADQRKQDQPDQQQRNAKVEPGLPGVRSELGPPWDVGD